MGLTRLEVIIQIQKACDEKVSQESPKGMDWMVKSNSLRAVREGRGCMNRNVLNISASAIGLEITKTAQKSFGLNNSSIWSKNRGYHVLDFRSWGKPQHHNNRQQLLPGTQENVNTSIISK